MSKRLERRYSSEGFFHVHRFLFMHMTHAEAILLCELMNRSAQFKAIETNSGWFVASNESLIDSISMKKTTQAKHLKNLMQLGLIRYERSGMPAVRYVLIEFDAVEKLELIESPSRSLSERQDVRIPNGNSKKASLSFHSENNHDSKNRDDEENNMYFEELNDVKETYSKFDLQCATKLKNWIGRKTQRRNLAKVTSWADQFRILRTKEEVDQDRIESVLSWYINNMLEKYTPVAHSAKAFRAKFTQIEEAKQRQEQNDLNVSMCDEVEALFDELSFKYNWDAGIDSLPKFLQTTFDEFAEFRKDLLGWADCGSTETAIGIRSHLIDATQFTRVWAEQIHKQVTGWAEWNGDLSSFAWAVDSKHFNRGGVIACQHEQRWEIVKETLYEN